MERKVENNWFMCQDIWNCLFWQHFIDMVWVWHDFVHASDKTGPLLLHLLQLWRHKPTTPHRVPQITVPTILPSEELPKYNFMSTKVSADCCAKRKYLWDGALLVSVCEEGNRDHRPLDLWHLAHQTDQWQYYYSESFTQAHVVGSWPTPS